MRQDNVLDANQEHESIMLKALVVGDVFISGRPRKSALIRAWTHEIFSDHNKSTIGIDFALKVIHWSADTIIRLQLWDIAGQERFGNMTRVYYREAAIAFIVCDLNEISTFESVPKWKNDLASKIQDPNLTIVLLLTNSRQYTPDLISPEEMDRFIENQGIDNWFAVDPNSLDEAPLRFAIGRYLEKSRPNNDTTVEVVEEENRVGLFGRLAEYAVGRVKRIFSRPDNSRFELEPSPYPLNSHNDNNAPAQALNAGYDAALYDPEPKANAVVAEKPVTPNDNNAPIPMDLTELNANAQTLEALINEMKSKDLYDTESVDGVPSQFICPFTVEIMVKPVKASDDHNYEYDAIRLYMKVQRVANRPLFGKAGPIPNYTLKPNLVLQEKIIVYCKASLEFHLQKALASTCELIQQNNSPIFSRINSSPKENASDEERLASGSLRLN